MRKAYTTWSIYVKSIFLIMPLNVPKFTFNSLYLLHLLIISLSKIKRNDHFILFWHLYELFSANYWDLYLPMVPRLQLASSMDRLQLWFPLHIRERSTQVLSPQSSCFRAQGPTCIKSDHLMKTKERKEGRFGVLRCFQHLR